MSRSKFGWSLPPGVTNRMIEEAAGGDPEAEAFEEAFHTHYDNLNDGSKSAEELAIAMCEWAWKQMGEAYKKGYDQGGADRQMALELTMEKKDEC